MSELKLSRPVERWQNCDPEVMAMQSEAALRFAFADMRHDILALHKELERLRTENAELLEHCQSLIDASGQECGCGYDTPEDICLGHTPMINKLKAERDRLRQKILGHNQTCVNSCAFDCSEDMSGSCVDCPQSWMIKTDWAEEA